MYQNQQNLEFKHKLVLFLVSTLGAGGLIVWAALANPTLKIIPTLKTSLAGRPPAKTPVKTPVKTPAKSSPKSTPKPVPKPISVTITAMASEAPEDEVYWDKNGGWLLPAVIAFVVVLTISAIRRN